jgi:toxin-antitoxin system PIN domain toxin
VILVDANLLVYAKVSGLPQHKASRAWLDQQLSGSDRVGLPWATVLAFVRLVSNPRIFERPQSVGSAWDQVEEWLGVETAWIPQPTERHAEILRPLLHGVASRSNLVPDAHLAAIAIEHGLTLCSTDGDFGRFPGLSWRDPLRAV